MISIVIYLSTPNISADINEISFPALISIKDFMLNFPILLYKAKVRNFLICKELRYDPKNSKFLKNDAVMTKTANITTSQTPLVKGASLSSINFINIPIKKAMNKEHPSAMIS
jgi:hypothetical protein